MLPETVDLHKRAKVLLQDLESQEADVVVPTIVLAEFLCGIDPPNHGKVVSEFHNKFKHIPLFDAKASAKAAQLWVSHRKPPKEQQVQRRFLKPDVMVVASAWSAGADILYSNELECQSIARLAGLNAQGLPTHSINLLTQAEIMDNKDI